MCPYLPSAAEAEFTVSTIVVTYEPLPHNAHHFLNIKTIFRKTQEGRGRTVSRPVSMTLCFCVFVFTFVCINLCLCVHLLCMCPTPPHSIHLLFCDGWQTCSEEGEGSLIRKYLFDSRNPGSFFCQKAKNIRKRTFLCVAYVVGEVGHGGTWGREEEKGRLSISTDSLQGYTSACE